MQKALLIVFHVTTCLLFAFAIYYSFMYAIVPHNFKNGRGPYGGKFRLLTYWNAILQSILFLLCFLNDCFGTNAVNPKETPFIRKLKDYIHATLGFPYAMFVGLSFWLLMFINRELVFPKSFDPYFPLWLSHVLHTVVMISIILEMIFAPRQYPKRSYGIGISLSFIFAYLTWIHIIYFNSGEWVYPIMKVLALPLRILIFAAMIMICLILYLVGEILNYFLWGNQCNKNLC